MDAYETFTQVAQAERYHEDRYLALLKNVKEERSSKKTLR